MAILDELTEQEVSKNKAIRGYIVRAHETGRNLVCRLLLEKKKKKIKKKKKKGG